MNNEDVPPDRKVKGVLAQLNRYTCDGKRIGSKLVFQPSCDYYVPKWNDVWADTEFTDVEDAVKKFGRKAVERALKGEIVKTQHNIGEFSVKEKCKWGDDFIKVRSKCIYPYESFEERLVRKKLYDERSIGSLGKKKKKRR